MIITHFEAPETRNIFDVFRNIFITEILNRFRSEPLLSGPNGAVRYLLTRILDAPSTISRTLCLHFVSKSRRTALSLFLLPHNSRGLTNIGKMLLRSFNILIPVRGMA